jgi:hypothetical protein
VLNPQGQTIYKVPASPFIKGAGSMGGLLKPVYDLLEGLYEIFVVNAQYRGRTRAQNGCEGCRMGCGFIARWLIAEMLAATIGTDGHRRLQAVDAGTDLPWLRDIPAVQTLRQVTAEQYISSSPSRQLRQKRKHNHTQWLMISAGR